MADKKAVVAVLNKLKAPHLTVAFTRAANPESDDQEWINEPEIKNIIATARKRGPGGVSASERKAILEIEKYDKIRPKAKTYLRDIQEQWKRTEAGAATAKRQGIAVSLEHAAKYKGQYIGEGRLKGQCATGVQVVFIDAGKPLGLTRTWKEGIKVKGNKIKPGTAIASFREGRYADDHAAIFIRETEKGLEVWDQWTAKRWGKRTLRFDYNGNSPYSNDGDLFSVIEKRAIPAK